MERQSLNTAGLKALNRAHVASKALQRLEDDIAQAVLEAREGGATWKIIGQALGVSGQACWEKYSPSKVRSDTPGQETLWSVDDSTKNSTDTDPQLLGD